MLELEGHITISRMSRDGGIQIEISDVGSSCVALRFRMTPEAFANVLTGMGHVKGEMEFNGSGIIGKVREFKRVSVTVPGDSWKASAETIRKAVAEHEVDGWEGRDSDAKNSHNRVAATPDGTTYNVLFERWVDRKGEE